MVETLTLKRRDLESLIGNTPLVRLRAFEPTASIEIYAKLESHNPGGSVKDRAALAMILDGERAGALTPDRTLLDATSGNTGIAYAMIAAARGYRVRLCLPSNVTKERIRLLEALGADLVLTDPMEGSDGAILEARRIHATDPGRYFYPDQYNNPANWRAHFESTGPEIAAQSDGRATHFVAGLGTSGTFVGAGRRLRQLIAIDDEYATAVAARVEIQPRVHFGALRGVQGDVAGDRRRPVGGHGAGIRGSIVDYQFDGLSGLRAFQDQCLRRGGHSRNDTQHGCHGQQPQGLRHPRSF